MQQSNLRTWEILAVYCGIFVVFQIFIFQTRSSWRSKLKNFDTSVNPQMPLFNDASTIGTSRRPCDDINKALLTGKTRNRAPPRNITTGEAKRCFRNTTFYFLGDSQQRNFYSALVAVLKGLDTFRMNANATPDYYADESIRLTLVSELAAVSF
ncbi:hypothetical protein RvY_05038-2 [Ramazzottius varieornatus]|uniref:Uncharacterized protein n=1 Tax=Ramazzottius varieornatus TaxID=947166 RepID=A0A1D1UTN7_RAMVA|nr:hypothetical protein RvY_05038-2 [Ramazzottius varieornatus]